MNQMSIVLHILAIMNKEWSDISNSSVIFDMTSPANDYDPKS